MSSHRFHLPRSIATWFNLFYSVAVVFWIAAVLVRLSVRDLSPFSLVTVFYYMSPGVLLFLGAGLLMFYAGAIRRYRLAATWCVMAVVVAQCAGSHHVLPVQYSDSSQQQKTYRILLWNTCHGRHGWENVVEELNRHQADIIALRGSVELSVTAGLADVIVDIVETGTTLKQNGLVVHEELFPSSARLIVNKASHKLKLDLIDRLLSVQ